MNYEERGPMLIESFVPINLCEQIIKAYKQGQPKSRSYQGIVDLKVRNSTFVPLPTRFISIFSDSIRLVMEEYFGLPIDDNIESTPLIYGYPVGIGFILHHDLVTQIERERGLYNGQPVIGGDFSVVLFVNDPIEYLGGELYFPNHNCEFKPPRGSVVAFPATEDFVHGVRPILSGIRFSVLCRMNRKQLVT